MEETAEPPSQMSTFGRITRFFQKRIHQASMQRQWKANSFPKSFNWRWEKTNFNRVALVNLLCAGKLDGDYLEIGCQGNKLFDSVPMKNKVGVDPESGGTVKKTSDDFFAASNQKFDVIFIDGLHTYEQVRLDVINSIDRLKDGGWIALHDMLPQDWREEHVPRVTIGVWAGDVWKVAFELANSPGIDFKIIRIDHGVGVFRVLSPKPALKNMSDVLTKERFAYFYKNVDKLPLVDWPSASEWIQKSKLEQSKQG